MRETLMEVDSASKHKRVSACCSLRAVSKHMVPGVAALHPWASAFTP